MSSEQQLDEGGRENSYPDYNLYYCKQCDTHLAMHELPAHVAKEHRGLRFDLEGGSSSSSGTEPNRTANGIGQNVQLHKHPLKYSKFARNYTGKHQHDAASAAPTAPLSITTDAKTSGDETDFRPFDPSQSINNRVTFDNDGIASTSTPNAAMPSGQTTYRRSRNRQQKAGEMVQERQHKIPTALEIFNLSHNQSETQTPNAANGTGDGSDRAAEDDNGGHDNGRRKKFKFRRQSRAAAQRPPPVIPENFAACRFCSNIMHQDYLNGHIERKHQVAAAGAEDSGISIANVSNDNGGPIGVGKIKTAKDQINSQQHCQFCSAQMHSHYLPLHLVQKHRSEYNESIGVCWAKLTDSQMNNLFNANRIHVKNGAFYINGLE